MSYHISSSIWPGLKSLLSTVQHHSSWQIGNGLNINFWTDCWLEKPVTDILNIPAELHGNLKTKVSHFLRNGSCQILNSLLQHFPVLCNDWLNITVPNDPVPDKRVWSYSSSGQLSLKDAYMFLFLAGNSLSCFKSIWKSCIPPSKSMLLWRLMHNKVATDENLRIRGCTVVSICSLCNTAVESSQHLFFDCAFATEIWNWLAYFLELKLNHSSLNSILSICFGTYSKQASHVLLAVVTYVFWGIWHCRNCIGRRVKPDHRAGIPGPIRKLRIRS